MTLISSYINRFPNVRILCVGDVMLDEFIYGRVDRISPEAPVPVFKRTHAKKMLGGAGNVVANLCALGCKTSFIAAVGNDNAGHMIRDMLDEIGADAHLATIDGWPTIMKTRMISGVTHLLRADCEEKLDIPAATFDALMDNFSKMVPMCDVVLLSDYNKGLLNADTTPRIIDIARRAGRPVIIDPKGTHYEKYAGATLVKPNLKEFAEATAMSFNPAASDFHNSVTIGARKLFEQYGIQNLIVTLSEHGMLYVSADAPDDILQIPTVAREVFDVSGAGDTSMAALGAAIGANAPIRDAMKLANRASGIVVGKLGTATVSSDELYDAVAAAGANDDWVQRRKIITAPQAARLARALRDQGRVVGFTNGCFDCCHLGHLHSFVQAKKNCDVLFVGINSDASVRRAKGPARPIQDEKTRALLLASMEFVDYVIVFDDDTALGLIDAIHPDVIAKEGYALDNWPEAKHVISYGGRAITLTRLEGYSTTGLFNKIRG